MAFTSYIVQNDIDFQRAIGRLGTVTQDFRIPFGQIASSFFKENKAIFKLKKGGAYPDYGGHNPRERVKFKGIEVSRRTKAKFLKKRKVGFIYPMLVETGRLAASLTQPSDPQAVKVIQKLGMELGTTVEYAKHHQYGTKHMPMRKVVFIGGGPTDETKGDNRRDRWLNILNNYVLKKIKQAEF